jgi:hypothetical protein
VCFELRLSYILTSILVGNGAQQALVSWWPLPKQWNNTASNGHNWGYWTEWDELWYRQRLSNIRDGGPLGLPFTTGIWRSKLKGASAARSVTNLSPIHSQKLFFRGVRCFLNKCTHTGYYMPVSLAINLSDCIDPLADLTVGTWKLAFLKISYVLLGPLLAFLVHL